MAKYGRVVRRPILSQHRTLWLTLIPDRIARLRVVQCQKIFILAPRTVGHSSFARISLLPAKAIRICSHLSSRKKICQPAVAFGRDDCLPTTSTVGSVAMAREFKLAFFDCLLAILS
jgi:hypothetical protein